MSIYCEGRSIPAGLWFFRPSSEGAAKWTTAGTASLGAWIGSARWIAMHPPWKEGGRDRLDAFETEDPGGEISNLGRF